MKHINTVYDHSLIKSMLHTSGLDAIYQKVMDHERLSFEDGVQLFETRDLTSVGYMANIVRERMHGDR
ncbi:MAG TPA: hypothetical protein PKV06_06960, partial [bacterium]|nr:hypothetical protein [bacterium]